jgi:thiamine biosynthesis protein ThiS
VNERTFIEISINGASHRIAPETTVPELIEQLGLTPGRLAIELNLSLLPRAAWAETKLQAGDKLEIVHFVGGG